jgi:hypothetical protein
MLYCRLAPSRSKSSRTMLIERSRIFWRRRKKPTRLTSCFHKLMTVVDDADFARELELLRGNDRQLEPIVNTHRRMIEDTGAGSRGSTDEQVQMQQQRQLMWVQQQKQMKALFEEEGKTRRREGWQRKLRGGGKGWQGSS